MTKTKETRRTATAEQTTCYINRKFNRLVQLMILTNSSCFQKPRKQRGSNENETSSSRSRVQTAWGWLKLTCVQTICTAVSGTDRSAAANKTSVWHSILNWRTDCQKSPTRQEKLVLVGDECRLQLTGVTSFLNFRKKTSMCHSSTTSCSHGSSSGSGTTIQFSCQTFSFLLFCYLFLIVQLFWVSV